MNLLFQQNLYGKIKILHALFGLHGCFIKTTPTWSTLTFSNTIRNTLGCSTIFFTVLKMFHQAVREDIPSNLLTFSCSKHFLASGSFISTFLTYLKSFFLIFISWAFSLVALWLNEWMNFVSCSNLKFFFCYFSFTNLKQLKLSTKELYISLVWKHNLELFLRSRVLNCLLLLFFHFYPYNSVR